MSECVQGYVKFDGEGTARRDTLAWDQVYIEHTHMDSTPALGRAPQRCASDKIPHNAPVCAHAELVCGVVKGAIETEELSSLKPVLYGVRDNVWVRWSDDGQRSGVDQLPCR